MLFGEARKHALKANKKPGKTKQNPQNHTLLTGT